MSKVINLRKPLKWLLLILLILLFLFSTAMAVRFAFPVRHLDLVRQLSEQNGLEPSLVLAVINTESRFRPNAESHAGAKGLMQLMDSTAVWVSELSGLHGYAERIFEPEANIALGTWYLARLLRQFEDQQTALAAYNAGSGNVSRWLANPDYSYDGVTLHTIPFTETRNYVRRVARNQRVYEFLLRWVYR